MMDGAKAGHFAYIGDSILGKDVNLGAGTKLANFKMLAGSIVVTADKKKYDTGRRKLGAILGDRTETGCNLRYFTRHLYGAWFHRLSGSCRTWRILPRSNHCQALPGLSAHKRYEVLGYKNNLISLSFIFESGG